MNINRDSRVVKGFGDEWTRFDQSKLSNEELEDLFNCYFRIFPWSALPENAVGFDMACGSGRWAKLVAPKVGKLYCIDASSAALKTAKRTLEHIDNCEILEASFENIPLEDNSMDFGYILGALHCVPDAASAIQSCVNKLKPGALLLLYTYYAFDNKPMWFRAIWRISDIARRFISKLPFGIIFCITQAIALLIYYPLARISLLFERLGFNVDSFPLSAYRKRSFYTMATNARDRFGTRLEKRFTLPQIKKMMEDAGLERIQFSESVPYWCAVGYKKG